MSLASALLAERRAACHEYRTDEGYQSTSLPHGYHSFRAILARKIGELRAESARRREHRARWARTDAWADRSRMVATARDVLAQAAHVRAHGGIKMSRGADPMTASQWSAWFHSRLNEKINRGDRVGRKHESEYQIGLRRDAWAMRSRTSIRRFDTPELNERLSHRLFSES